jgi:hypothetical protein
MPIQTESQGEIDDTNTSATTAEATTPISVKMWPTTMRLMMLPSMIVQIKM